MAVKVPPYLGLNAQWPITGNKVKEGFPGGSLTGNYSHLRLKRIKTNYQLLLIFSIFFGNSVVKGRTFLAVTANGLQDGY